MPGWLLRTNGVIAGDESACFVFEGEDLFPRGVTLELESVVLDATPFAGLPGLARDLDRRAAARLIDALEGLSPAQRQEIHAALVRCAAERSLGWLDEEVEGRPELKKRIERLLAALRPE
jgi:hypothetical protein